MSISLIAVSEWRDRENVFIWQIISKKETTAVQHLSLSFSFVTRVWNEVEEGEEENERRANSITSREGRSKGYGRVSDGHRQSFISREKGHRLLLSERRRKSSQFLSVKFRRDEMSFQNGTRKEEEGPWISNLFTKNFLSSLFSCMWDECVRKEHARNSC